MNSVKGSSKVDPYTQPTEPRPFGDADAPRPAEKEWLLFIAHHSDAPQTVGECAPLTVGGTTSIGRSPECKMFPPEAMVSPGISRKHLTIDFSKSGIRLKNESTHGTWVNGELRASVNLSDGDVIRMGPVLFLVRHTVRARPRPNDPDLIGCSHAIATALRLITLAAEGSYPVLLRGETGTGKEVAAKLIHERGPRHRFPYVAVALNTLSVSLVQTELFGAARGAFTGALPRKGLIAKAHEGTLFLDEIAKAPLEVQGQLLRFIEDGMVRPVGGEEVQTDTRVVAASNEDFEALIAERAFYDDLYNRLAACTIELPRLYDRAEDIPLLARHFVAKFDKEHRRPIEQSFMLRMLRYRWLHNVRELRHVVQMAVEYAKQEGTPDIRATKDLTRQLVSAQVVSEPRRTKESFSREELEELLRQCGGNVSAVAQMANVARSTVYELMEKFSLDAAKYRTEK